MRGTEDLGGGLSALFSLQNGFNVNTGKMNSRLLLGARHILNASARLVRAG
jgi:predicted porin